MRATLVLLSLLAASAGHAESCLATAKSSEHATRAKTRYAFERPGHAIDATGVRWRGIGHHAIRLRGGFSACWSGGTIEGPLPEAAVYECAPEHGYRGGACESFHITAGIAAAVGAPETRIEDVLISDYGDGVSLESSSGAVSVRRAYLRDLHDDAVENDFGQILTVTDSLIERANIAFAARPRSQDRYAQRGTVFTIRNNLILLHRFTNTYKQKPGHGGFFKWPEDGSGPQFAVTDNVFVMDDPGSGQLTLPLLDQVAECRNNRLLWAGSVAAYRVWLSDGGDHSDGLPNNWARLELLAHCYAITVKPDEQSKAAFLAEHWEPLVARWKAAHPAGGGRPHGEPGSGARGLR